MDDPEPRRGRVHDAEGARRAILDAAEEVFAEHGFDGARVDAIAATAGYNKSLIFQYFGDKLNLYAEVLKRADRDLNRFQAQMFTRLLEDDTIISDARQFRALFTTIIQGIFDYLLGHPRLVRMILWEVAEGWQTYAKILAQLTTDDIGQFELLFQKAHRAGLLRSDFNPVAQLSQIIQICISYMSWLPIYQMLAPGEDFSSDHARAQAREYIVAAAVAGILRDVPEA